MGRGQLDSSLADPDWHIPQPEVRPAALLEQLVRSGHFDETVGALLPAHKDYRELREALLRYLAVQKSGGWPAFQHSGRKLKPGDAARTFRNCVSSCGWSGTWQRMTSWDMTTMQCWNVLSSVFSNGTACRAMVLSANERGPSWLFRLKNASNRSV